MKYFPGGVYSPDWMAPDGRPNKKWRLVMMRGGLTPVWKYPDDNRVGKPWWQRSAVNGWIDREKEMLEWWDTIMGGDGFDAHLEYNIYHLGERGHYYEEEVS